MPSFRWQSGPPPSRGLPASGGLPAEFGAEARPRSGGDQRNEGEVGQRDEANRNIRAGDAVDPLHAPSPWTHLEVIEARVVNSLALAAGRTRPEHRTRAGIVPGSGSPVWLGFPSGWGCRVGDFPVGLRRAVYLKTAKALGLTTHRRCWRGRMR
jgi:hypothetical protein